VLDNTAFFRSASVYEISVIFIPLLDVIAKLRKATTNFVVSVRPSARNNSPPLDGFSWNLIL